MKPGLSLQQHADWLAPYLGTPGVAAPDTPATVQAISLLIAGALVGEKTSLLAGPATTALADQIEAALTSFVPTEIRYEDAKTRRFLPGQLMFEFQRKLREHGVVALIQQEAA